MARYSWSEFKEAVINGEFDTDDGGRNPQVREAIRRKLWDLAEALDLIKEEWRYMTQEDLLLFQHLMAEGQIVATDAGKVRLAQSRSNAKRGKY